MVFGYRSLEDDADQSLEVAPVVQERQRSD